MDFCGKEDCGRSGYSLSRDDTARVRALEVVTVFSFAQERGRQGEIHGVVEDDETAGEEIARCQHGDVECTRQACERRIPVWIP